MILNGSKLIRKPSIIDDTENGNLVSWVNSKIEEYLRKGYRSFTIKELFGTTHWDWTNKKYPIQIIYYRWHQKYELENPRLSENEISAKAFDAAGVSVGYIIKQACTNSNRSFKVTHEFRTTRYSVV